MPTLAAVSARPGGLTEEQRRLAALPEGELCVRAAVRRWGRSYPSLRSDFASAANMARCDAARDYDPERGAAFPTFLRRVIDRALWKVVRSNQRWPDQEFESAARSTADLAPSREESERQEAEFDRLVSGLPGLEQRILNLRFVSDESYTEIGRLLGCTPRWAQELCDRALAKLSNDPIVRARVEL